MKNLLLFLLISTSSFSQEIGETKTVKATLTYVDMFDASVVLVFTDSSNKEFTVSMDNWLLDYDIVEFASSSEGKTFMVSLEYMEVYVIEWNGSKYVTTSHAYKDWALLKIDNL